MSLLNKHKCQTRQAEGKYKNTQKEQKWNEIIKLVCSL